MFDATTNLSTGLIPKGNLATTAFQKVTPLLGLPHKRERVTGAIKFHAEIFMIFGLAGIYKLHVQNIQVTIPIQVDEVWKVIGARQ